MGKNEGYTLRHGQRISEDGENTFITGECVLSGEKYTTEALNRKGLIDWLVGSVVIQIALPKASLEDREFLISGICPTEQNKIFGSPEKDEEGFI